MTFKVCFPLETRGAIPRLCKIVLKNCVHYLEKFQKKKSTQDFDKAAEDLRLATRHLGMIVGKVDVEELLGSIFNDFCIGK